MKPKKHKIQETNPTVKKLNKDIKKDIKRMVIAILSLAGTFGIMQLPDIPKDISAFLKITLGFFSLFLFYQVFDEIANLVEDIIYRTKIKKAEKPEISNVDENQYTK